MSRPPESSERPATPGAGGESSAGASGHPGGATGEWQHAARESQSVRMERRSRAPAWRSQDVLRAAALIIGFYLLLQLLWVVNPLVLTAFLGILFGLAVEAGVDRLEKFRIPRGVSAVTIVLGFYLFLFGVGAWMAPTIREQAGQLRRQLPQAVDKVEDWIREREDGLFGAILPAPSRTPGTPTDSAARAGRDSVQADVTARQPDESPAEQATEEPVSLRERIGLGIGQVSGYLFPFLSSTIAVFGGLVLITFLAIYIGADPDTYHRGLMHLFPHRARKRAGEVLSATATVLRRWLVTQLIAMTVIGVVTTIGLLILDVKAAFALGLIAGLLEFIPTLGPILSAVPAVAMGFVDSPEKALYVVILYIGIQFVENNVLIPYLMKEVDLPPALTIMSQALMAIVFGFLGLMVAVPLVAGLMVPIKMLYVEDVVGDDVTILGEEEDAELEGEPA